MWSREYTLPFPCPTWSIVLVTQSSHKALRPGRPQDSPDHLLSNPYRELFHMGHKTSYGDTSHAARRDAAEHLVWSGYLEDRKSNSPVGYRQYGIATQVFVESS